MQRKVQIGNKSNDENTKVDSRIFNKYYPCIKREKQRKRDNKRKTESKR